VNLIYTDK